MDPALQSLACSIANQYGLPPEIVCGQVERESSWETNATRYEPAFFVRYIEPMIDSGALADMQEAKNRATSFGLLQIMGQVARELGYDGPLESLLIPEIGLAWGCEKLAKCLSSAGNIAAALQRYNGGNNPNYAAEVMQNSQKYKES